MDYIDKLPEVWVDPRTGKTHRPKDFLERFTAEYVNADFTGHEKRVHRKKRAPSEKNKHIQELRAKTLNLLKEINNLVLNSKASTKTKLSLRSYLKAIRKKIEKSLKSEIKYIKDYYKKDSEDRNNARNACILTRSKAQGKVTDINEIRESDFVNNNIEDSLIEMIDNKNKLLNDQD